MRYTNRTIVVSRSRISAAEARIARQREMVEKLENSRHPADNAVALLLVMEQSLLSMRRFLATLERDLGRSLGIAEKPRRRKAERQPAKASTDEIAQQVVGALQGDGIEAERIDIPAATSPTRRSE